MNALVTFDLKLENLSEFLNSIVSHVNSHGEYLKIVASELKNRASYDDLQNCFKALAGAVPSSLGGKDSFTGNWAESVDSFSTGISSVCGHIETLDTNQRTMENLLNDMKNELKTKCDFGKLKKNKVKLAELIRKHVSNEKFTDKTTSLGSEISSVNESVTKKLRELETSLAALEVNTL